MDVVDPAGSVQLDRAALDRYPVGYRYLAYLQRANGHDVMFGLPGLRGPEVELLYTEGAQWLAGSAHPGTPLKSDHPGVVVVGQSSWPTGRSISSLTARWAGRVTM